ncbi:unnamed protein product [Prunus brigantina]
MSDSLVRVSRRAEWGAHEADAGSTRMPRHAETARAAYHDRVDGTRWFTGFCNSHQVSHFATFFIDARAEISVAESRFDIFEDDDAARAHRFRGDGDALSRSSSLAQFAPVQVSTMILPRVHLRKPCYDFSFL